MVKIVIAGGLGDVAREVIDVLLAQKKHEITVLTRRIKPEKVQVGTKVVEVDYTDKSALIPHLTGAHTVLSFVTDGEDPRNIVQKNLIDASVETGVKRFAPSEWAQPSNSGLPWYAGKDLVREYLEEINKDKKVLEYCCFQPGTFVNYLGYPHRSSKYMSITPFLFDFENRRAIVVGDASAQISLTTVQDLSKVVAAAVEYEGEWPTTGGVRGGQITIAELLKLGADIRGAPFALDKVELKDLEAGELKTSWAPAFSHPSVPEEQLVAFGKIVMIGSLQAIERGSWNVSDEWNQLLPEFEFTGIEIFLRDIWAEKP